MIVPNLQARTDVVHGLFRITKKHFHLGECPIWALGGEYLFQWWNTKLPWWDNPPESILHLRNSKRYISIHVHSSYIFQKKNVSCNVSYKGHCSSRRVDYPPHCSQFPWSASARHTACISKSQWLASHRWDYWGHLGSRDSRCHWLQPRCLGIFWGRNLVNAIFKA